MHVRRAHPNEADEMNVRINIKARWTEEEMALFAIKEASALREGGIRFMNQHLSDIFPNRSVEAIKKLRQKTTYKELVRLYTINPLPTVVAVENIPQSPSKIENINNTISPPLASTPTLPDASVDSIRNGPVHLIEFTQKLPRVNSDSEPIRVLNKLCDNALRMSKTEVLNQVSMILDDILPPKRFKPRVVLTPSKTLNSRLKRRAEFSRTQHNWNKHQGRCIKEILKGNEPIVPPSNESMNLFWREVMEKDCTTSPVFNEDTQDLKDLLSPITIEEVINNRIMLNSAPGPDCITPKQLREISPNVLARIYNLILWTGDLPSRLCLSRTTFIPKSSGNLGPSDYRPITVSSVIVRQFHNILARRFSNLVEFNNRQRAFLPLDGCRDNTIILDLLLRYHQKQYKSCYMASLDVSKAFDSISHFTIFSALQSIGVPEHLTKYIKSVYKNSRTVFADCSTKIMPPPIYPKRGVKQGDPLSPLLFNIIIDRLFKYLPAHCAAELGHTKVNALAFADDIILVSKTPDGLQHLLDTTNNFLTACGLSLNSSKCLSLGLQGQGKQKKTVVVDSMLTISGRLVPAVKRTDQFKYLGICFSSEGRTKVLPHNTLIPKLNALTKAPLKPQQRLHALRSVLIPQHFHLLSLGRTTIGALNKFDIITRSFARKWLHLPNDVPVAFFHTPVKLGGLGIPSVRWQAPLNRWRRLHNVELPNLEGEQQADEFLASEIAHMERRLNSDRGLIKTSKQLEDYWSKKLYLSVDGAGLKTSGDAPTAHRWIAEPTKLLSGKDFINLIRLRINTLHSLSRATRGNTRRYQDRFCRAGCRVPETLNHILQKCGRTNGPRIDRHNNVAKFVARRMKDKGYNVVEEQIFPTRNGNRKPDLVCRKDDKVIVIDAQVVTDSYDLDEAHRRKTSYYTTDTFKEAVLAVYKVTSFIMLTVTLSYRGIWSGKSLKGLKDEGILLAGDEALLSTQVGIGSIAAHRLFNTSTAVGYKKGIG